MLHKKIVLRLCLFALTGLACGLFSKIASTATPAGSTEPSLYSINDALTIAMQTILAKTEDTAILVPATDKSVVDSQTPMLSNTDASSQFTILGEHKVVAGETISCIGRAYRVLPKAIADVNGIDLISELKAGQILRIPAVPWTTISMGPVCKPQFTVLNSDMKTPQGSQPTIKKPDEDVNVTGPSEPKTTQPSVSDATQPPPSNETEPPAGNDTEPPPFSNTEPPPADKTEPPVIGPPRPCLPPICIIRPTIIIITAPPTEDPGMTKPPPTQPPATEPATQAP